MMQSLYRGGSGGPAGTVWAGPLFEFLTLLLAINHYKPIYQLITFQKPEQHLSNSYSIHRSTYRFIVYSYHVMICGRACKNLPCKRKLLCSLISFVQNVVSQFRKLQKKAH